LKKKDLQGIMKNDLAIYGAGGFGREVALMIRQINQHENTWNLIGFYDDGKNKGSEVDGFPVLGGLEDLRNRNTPLNVVVGIADPRVRKKIVERIDGSRISFPVITHPSVLAGDTSVNRFGRGSIITAGCILTTGITLGEFVIINLATTIGHDVNIQHFTSVMPACNISGFVDIGEGAYVGSGAVILPQVSLGADCVVGAGAVVTKSVDASSTVMGVPATPKM
jgi:sugar O-acyltransferase (sialic acid O-acetyltransferase NeuD family)